MSDSQGFRRARPRWRHWPCLSLAVRSPRREAPRARPKDGISLRPGLSVHGEHRSLSMDRQIDHASTPSKSAEPTRTRVAPSSIAASKSLDMPIDSAESGRPVRCRSASRVWRSWMNEGLAVSASVPQPAIVISPAIGMLRHAAMASASSRILSADQPCLDSSPDVLTCKQIEGGLDSSRQRVQQLQELERIDSVDHPHQRHGPPGLVGLEVPDEMPAHGLFELRQRFDLPPELLGVVLAQVEHARRDQRADQIRRPLLRNRDQLDRRFSPARAARGRRDPASNRFHILANSIAAIAQLCTLDDTPSGKTAPRGVVTTAVAPTPG